MRDTVVVIPAYKPDGKLTALVQELIEIMPVIVIDDGGGADYAVIFQSVRELGATVLTHEINRGKGAALKTAFSYMSENMPGMHAVTADADGQHSVEDIVRIAQTLQENPSSLILGGRDFSKMPLRSRAGNTITSLLFHISAGLNVVDTQTGLRGIPMGIIPQMPLVAGDRYEYELNVLLSVRGWGIGCIEIPIRTIYLDGNRSSHFHAIRDGLRVLSQLLKYTASSLACSLLDYGIYCLLLMVLSPAWSYAAARFVSAAVNYQLVSRLVFRKGPSGRSALYYFLLAAFSLCAGSMGTGLLASLHVHSVLAKLILDVVLFAFNYFVQKEWIFKQAEA